MTKAKEPPTTHNLPEGGHIRTVTIRSDEMAPRFDAGEVLVVNNQRPARAGDDVLIELTPMQGQDSGLLFVRRMRSVSKSTLVVSQFNPALTIKIPLSEVRQFHPIWTANEFLPLKGNGTSTKLQESQQSTSSKRGATR